MIPDWTKGQGTYFALSKFSAILLCPSLPVKIRHCFYFLVQVSYKHNLLLIINEEVHESFPNTNIGSTKQ